MEQEITVGTRVVITTGVTRPIMGTVKKISVTDECYIESETFSKEEFRRYKTELKIATPTSGMTYTDEQVLEILTAFANKVDDNSNNPNSKVQNRFALKLLEQIKPDLNQVFNLTKVLPHSVCAFIKHKETGLLLGVSRKYDHNDMGFPGGKVDPGETPDEAIVREVKEETGLDIIDPCEFFSSVYDGFIAHCYAATYSGEISHDTEKETGRVAWVTKEELLAGSFGDYNKDVFKVLKLII